MVSHPGPATISVQEPEEEVDLDLGLRALEERGELLLVVFCPYPPIPAWVVAPHERFSELPVVPREKSDTGAAAGENPRDAPVIAR